MLGRIPDVFAVWHQLATHSHSNMPSLTLSPHMGHTSSQAISALITADGTCGAARGAGEKSHGASRLLLRS